VAENFASYPATFLVEKEIKTVYIININCMNFILFISVHWCHYLNPTNALMYVNTSLFTLLHSHMFQHKRGYPEGELIHLVSRVNKIRVQM